jgi:hypothetical protein
MIWENADAETSIRQVNNSKIRFLFMTDPPYNIIGLFLEFVNY